jgi:RNA polymerase sigma factor (sigma-70 family)
VDSAIPSAELLNRILRGDEQAAATVFERYAERLSHLARSRLSARLAARTDPDDIVMSAYRSFFVGAREGRFHVECGGDLWRLLVEVTLHKLYRQAAHHHAQRRSVRRELAPTDSNPPLSSAASREPTAEEGLLAAEELENLLGKLNDRGRAIVELRLQGFTQEEIAKHVGCSSRTVRKWLENARKLLVSQATDSSPIGDIPPPSINSRRKSKTRRSPARQSKPFQSEANLAWSDFNLHQQIGAGSTGKVYRATRLSNGGQVAVKFLRKSLVRHPAVVSRFLREAQTASELKHPGIVGMHGAGRTPGGGYFLVMELVSGCDLHRIHHMQAVEPATAARWIVEAARTLDFAHQRGIIHCDLKPSNLLLDSQGRVLITDFGLATRLADSEPGLLAGTPAFMAPEQVDSVWGTVGPATDVWGLGTVLYTLLFRRPPHVGRNAADVLARVVSGQPVEFPAESAHALASPLIDILKHCLAKSQSQRFQTGGELADALARI